MANSSLATYVQISPNKSSPRNHTVDRITPHCYVGQASVEGMASWLCNPSAQASANYGIGADGRIGMFVVETDRSWCSSSSANDNRAITIECASDMTYPYAIKDVVYNNLINLMVDICKRYGKKKLLWLKDKDKTLAYEPKADEMILTVHRWFAAKECPGEYIYSRLSTIAETVTARLNGSSPEVRWYRVRKKWADVESQLGAYLDLEIAKEHCPIGYCVFDYRGKVLYKPVNEPKGIPQSKEDFLEKVSNIARVLYDETHILPSVVIAQCCLETGFGLGTDALELVKNNNLLGMKAELLNSTWQNYSVWDGKKFSKITPEVYNGVTKYITDSFRVYKDYENCIRDYEMFLLHVTSGGQYKYRKIIASTDPREVITIISKGGYATDPSYITKVMSIINQYNLTKYDAQVGAIQDSKDPDIIYRIQIGSFSNRLNAKQREQKADALGFKATTRKIDGQYKVQIGRYTKEKTVNKKLKEVKSAGFADAFIVVVK